VAGQTCGKPFRPVTENEKQVSEWAKVGITVERSMIPVECWTDEMFEQEAKALATVPADVEDDPYD